VSVNIFLPSMPAIVAAFGSKTTVVVNTVSIFMLGLGLGQLVYGPISDRFGRRRPLLFGLMLFAIGSVICSTATSIDMFILGRLVEALGAAAAIVLSRAIARDLFGRERAASMLGYTMMAATVGGGLAPVLGGFIHQVAGWRAVFLFLFALSVVLIIGCAWWLPVSQSPRKSRPDVSRLATMARLLFQRSFLRHALFSSFLFGCWQAFVSGVSLVVIGLWGASETRFALWWTTTSGAYILGNFLAGRLSTAHGSHRMITRGSWLVGAGATGLLAGAMLDIDHPVALFLPIGVLLIGSGMAQASAATSAMEANPEHIGIGSAMLGGMQIMFSIAAITVIAQLSFSVALPFAAVCSAMAFAGIAAYFALSASDGQT
jgi:DHA1 family bicyclomycin/chloramphenicol resistance-like MFS transporter